MKLPPTDELITLIVTAILALYCIALIVLTFMHPTEFKERYGQILGALLAYVIGYKRGDKSGNSKNKPPD